MQHPASFKGLFQAIVFTAFVLDLTWITSGKECGQRKVKYGDLMLGGVKTYSGKWPWHVAIAHPKRSGLQFVCGGSIINKNTILTAFVFDFARCTTGKECGQRKVKEGDLILGGQKAYPGKWPWHATITHQKHTDFEVVCGGSIIDKNTILTAAHCLYTSQGLISVDRLKVHVGRNRLSVIDQYTEEHVPAEFLIHPRHVWKSVHDDIALIKLENDIQMNDYVQPVCVCQDADESQIVGRNGTVMGFGLDINGTQPDHLLEAELSVVNWTICLDSNPEVFKHKLTQQMLCAGARNAVGPCNGDSGGGFVFNTGDAWCVQGIVSFTAILEDISRCDPHQYVVYTDVAKYIDWLQQDTKAQDQSSLKMRIQSIVFIAVGITFRFYASGQECGQRKMSSQGRMLGGQSTSSDMWPWHATITHRKYNLFKVVCGGSIIDKYTILTAAHCLYTAHGVITTSGVVVHVGRSQLAVSDRHTRAYVPAEFLIHPGHRQSSVEDDIALIRLRSEIELSEHVQPVCICPAGDDTQIVGKYGTVIGFGLNANDTMSDHLLEAEVPVVDRWECFKSNPFVFGSHLTRNMLCAGARNAVGPCNGDSGGGFVFHAGDSWCVRGIVSFTLGLNGTAICDPHQYVVYTDVTKYSGWLRRNTNALYYSDTNQFPVKTTQCRDGELCDVKVPESPQMACGLWKDEGSCFDFTLKMFFDVKYGDCRLFVYGGCEGNGNRFDTESECKNTCIKPAGKAICLLPKSEGHCRGNLPRWYYNTNLKTCTQFIYSGCHGNANRFKSLKECREFCIEDIPKNSSENSA
uniref:Peptidase S1 domain-containing protein n=1 Tax=Anopheles minimus TaxID=112268 RepID=A0A182VR03_9DIPT